MGQKNRKKMVTTQGLEGARPHRDELWHRLQQERFDVVIIGGGINGAGIARDAALRGLKVALLEKGDFGSGTSFRSSKLIHGGLRYLETYEFGLVRESTAERAVQMELAPHLARPVPFMFPVYKGDPHGLLFMDMGLWLYDMLALFRVPKVHRAMRERGVLSREPSLRSQGLIGGLHYYDCSTDDGRLTLENILDAISLGAVCLNYAPVEKILRDSKGAIKGVGVGDTATGGRSAEVHAPLVISTLGSWTDTALKGMGERREKMVRATRGTHLVVPRDRIPVANAVAMLSPRDQRPLFVIPWGEHTYVGTTDVDHEEGPDEVFASRDEVDYILEATNHYFPKQNVDRGDITGIWSGLRPLVHQPGVESTSKVSREHEIRDSEVGLLILIGGKLTTYRLMAKETVDRALEVLERLDELPEKVGASKTKHRPLPGGVGLDRMGAKTRVADISERFGISLKLADHLLHTYGRRAGLVLRGASETDRELVDRELEFIWAEVDFAVHKEMALDLRDVMVRRTLLALKEAHRSLVSAPEVAKRMGRLLNWDRREEARQVEVYTRWLKRSMEAVDA